VKVYIPKHQKYHSHRVGIWLESSINSAAEFSAIEIGQIVSSMPIHGGYTEFICLSQNELVPVPSGLDAAEAVSLILNYITAYQMMHHSAKANRVSEF